MPRKVVPEIPAEEIRRLYVDQNMTDVEIGAHFGFCAESMRRRRLAAGIPSRPKINRSDRKHPNKARKGPQNGFWKQGYTIDADGYKLVWSADHSGYIREHRLVMERRLGRKLLSTEVVHHIDGDKQNNSPENLELFASNAEHLAATLRGSCPNWSEEGYQRMLLSAQRKAMKQAATLAGLEAYARAHNTTVSRLRRSLSREQTLLVKKSVLLGRFEPLAELERERETIHRAWLALRQGERSVRLDRKREYLPSSTHETPQ